MLLVKKEHQDLDQPQGKIIVYSIYLFTFPNDKKYCGFTSSKPERRWGKDGAGYKKCPLVYRAITKYGWENIIKEVIFTSNDKEIALQKEKEIIQKLELTNPNIGYNLHEGGKPTGASSFLTEEGRKKISEANKGKIVSEETKEKLRKLATGRKHSEETKQKISELKKGQIPTNRIPIVQVDIITNEIICEFNSAMAAAKSIGSPDGFSNILKVCKNKRKTAYGFKWRFKNG